MSIKIENIEDLKSQQAQLKRQLAESKKNMQQKVSDLQEDLAPAQGMVKKVQAYMGAPKQNNRLLDFGVTLGVNTLLRKGIWRVLPTPVRWLLPFVLKRVSTNMLIKQEYSILNAAEKALKWFKRSIN